MLQLPIIRSLVSGLMLLLITFSIVPKKLLHDAVTDHIEFAAKNGAKDSQFHDASKGIACKCENLFAQPVFLVATQVFKLGSAPVFQKLAEASSDKFYSFQRFFFELRGPPAVVIV